MTQQAVVRVLLRSDRLQEALDQLGDLEVAASQVVVSEPEPGSYRDERPDLESRALVRAGATRVVSGASIGVVIGVLVALVVPQIRELAPMSAWLLAFAGAWVCGAVAATRSLYVERDDGPCGERLHEVDAASSEQLRLVTVRDVGERTRVVEAMADAGFILLDSVHPRVAAEEARQRTIAPDIDLTGEFAR